MENRKLLSQRINFAEIELFKNYCVPYNLKDKIIKIGHLDKPNELKYTENGSKALYKKKNKKQSLYFDEIYPLDSAGIFFTTDDEKIKKYYGEIFARIEVITSERSLEIKGDKLILKKYYLHKRRYAQTKYFKKTITGYILTINLKTGNINQIVNLGKGKTFRTNFFSGLQHILKNFLVYKPVPLDNIKNKRIRDLLIETFDDREFTEAVNKALNYKTRKGTLREVFDNILNFFIEKKNIKVHNTYLRHLELFYPTEKFLKKNDRKLVVSILDMYRIKSKITNKIVHQYPDMDIRVLAELCNLFGQDYPKYLASLDTEWFNPDRRKFDILTTPNKNYLTVNNNFVIESKIRTIDKERIIKFLNNVITQKGSDNREMFSTMLKSVVMIADHLNMLKIIREYDEFKNFDGLNVNDFMEEHTEFSTTIAKIKKGWTTEYQFNKDMLSDMEKPVAIEINVGDKTNPKVAIMTFYPKVLKTEEEYIEEGTFMHHCVASYADKDKSVIISMRTEDSKDRITCEFDGQSGACLQARHFCNAPIPADFDLALDTVKEKTKYYSRRGMLHHTHKKRVPLVINNIEVKPTIVEPRLNEGLFIF